MRKGLKISIILSLALIFCLTLISCGGNETKEPKTEITTSGLSVSDGVYYATVDVDVDTFDLSSKIKLEDGAIIIFSSSSEFDSTIDGSKIELVSGENTVYACVTDKYENEQEYTFKIYRKQMFTVEFETNGGSQVAPITVKEGTVIEAPQTVKSGYSFVWDFDFKNPITENMTVTASWSANNYKLTVDMSSLGEENVILDVIYGEEYSLEEYEVASSGYRFNGWYIVSDNGEAVKVPFNGEDTYLYANDVTVEPSFELIEYSITYVLEVGGTNPNNVIKFNVESVIELLDATWVNDEKVFVGWYTSSDFDIESKITSISGVSESITLWAKFEDVEFKTSVDLVNGEELYEYEFVYKSQYSLPSLTPEKGYIFDGWYLGEQKLDLEGFWQFKDAEITLTAKFAARENNIEYELFGGTNNEANVNDYNADMGDVTLGAPTFGSHIFLGWFTNPECTQPIEVLNVDTVTDEMTIYAKWQYVSNITVNLDGGETDEEIGAQFLYGESYTLPTPVKAGNLFAGWLLDGESIAQSGTWMYKQDKTLVASWVPTTIVINYVLNGGTQNENNPVSFDVFTGVIELLEPTKDHAIFMGWYRDSKFQEKIESIDTAVEREITLYAKWFDTNITVNYDANGGSVARPSVGVVYGSSYSLLTPERLGYQFDGWYLGGTKIAQTGVWDVLESEVTLVAHWSVITYNIEYDLDGFETDGLINEYTVNSDEIVLSPLVRDGYIFLGWENNGVLSQTITIAKGSTGNRSYKANWASSTDSRGFVYELRGDHMVCVGFTRQVDSTQKVYMPSEYFGYPVTAITTNAFTDFGNRFAQSSYKNESYYYTICIPMSITLIEADAFEGCNGICVALYRADDKSIIDSTKSADMAELREWEKGVIYSSGKSNKQVRDCIWGFRPAMGWSRYSAVQIPDDYE